MRFLLRLMHIWVFTVFCSSLPAQNYKSDRVKRAVEVLGVQVPADSLQPDTTITLVAKDGRSVCLRTDLIGDVEHIGVPLFNEVMHLLQPSPVYDFLEYALLNWKYKIESNQLYLSKVVFKKGDWETLLQERLNECVCIIENQEDKLYIVTWQKEDEDIAIIGIPIEYELLNNDTRRNMEKSFVKNLGKSKAPLFRVAPIAINEESLSIYGTEGLFVIPGKSYIIDLLNQNVYCKLTTVYETVDTIIGNKPVSMNMEAVLPVVVRDIEYPAETFANLLMCDDSSVPDVDIELDFHLSDYHHQHITMPLSQLKAFCRQEGCSFYFACDGVQSEEVRGVMFASNLPKGYNHLFCLRIPTEQLMSPTPMIQADVYLYIPPTTKEKLFGTAPTKKSGVNFKLP